MHEVTVICPKCRAEYSVPLLGRALARKLGVACLCGEPLFQVGEEVEIDSQTVAKSGGA
jgi:hypothetical protein